MNKVYFSLVVIVTIMALTVSCTISNDEESTSSSKNENSDLSSCGQTVLNYTPNAYRNCFSGNSSHGACETCGFYLNESSAQGSYDCITCLVHDNYSIDVIFGDCTGYCKEKGTESNPISSSSCTATISCAKE